MKAGMRGWMNVQCLNGHTWSEPDTSRLGKRAIEREQAGYLDALAVAVYDCPQCVDEHEHQDRLNHEFCFDEDAENGRGVTQMERTVLEDILSSINPLEASRILGKYPNLKDRFLVDGDTRVEQSHEAGAIFNILEKKILRHLNGK